MPPFQLVALKSVFQQLGVISSAIPENAQEFVRKY